MRITFTKKLETMDVVKTKTKKNWLLHSKVGLTSAVLVVLILMLIWANQASSTVSVARNSLLIEAVRQGDLRVEVEGYGSLTSDKQQLITAYTSATVKEIVLKPGATVSANSVIVRLENPELEQQVENARQELTQINANLRQLKLNNQREKLNESANLAEIESRLEAATLKREAEQILVKQGIVSSLTYQQSVLDQKQLTKRIQILKERIQQLELVHQESVKIQEERVKQQQGQLNIALDRLNKLTVRAGIDGVLQRLSVELGQSLAPGSEVALIGSITDLIALIRVPQNQIQQVQIGQQAIIDTRRDKIMGTVARIDPIVDNNSVEVEISLPASLPKSARPMSNVDGTIIADTLKNVKYIKRPAGIKSNTQVDLYKYDAGQQIAQLQTIKFGTQTGQFIEIRSGANLNEQFIISDLNNLQANNPRLSVE